MVQLLCHVFFAWLPLPLRTCTKNRALLHRRCCCIAARPAKPHSSPRLPVWSTTTLPPSLGGRPKNLGPVLSLLRRALFRFKGGRSWCAALACRLVIVRRSAESAISIADPSDESRFCRDFSFNLPSLQNGPGGFAVGRAAPLRPRLPPILLHPKKPGQ